MKRIIRVFPSRTRATAIPPRPQAGGYRSRSPGEARRRPGTRALVNDRSRGYHSQENWHQQDWLRLCHVCHHNNGQQGNRKPFVHSHLQVASQGGSPPEMKTVAQCVPLIGTVRGDKRDFGAEMKIGGVVYACDIARFGAGRGFIHGAA